MSTKFIRVSEGAGLILVLICALCLGFMGEAQAKDRILAAAPAGHNAVIAVEVDELRSSPFFETATSWMMAHPVLGANLKELEDRLDVELRKDITAFALLTNLPPLSPEMLADPFSILQGGGAELETDSGTVLVRGKFKAEEVIEKLSDGAKELVLDGERVVYAVDGSTLAIVRGDSTYQGQMRERLPTAAGPGEEYMKAASKFGPRQGIYLMVAPNLEEADQESARFAAIGARLGADIQLSLLLTMFDDERAQASAKEFEELRQSAGDNPLISLFGVTPALNNLSIRQNARDIQMQTSMSNDQVVAMLTNFARVAATAQDLELPLGGEQFGVGLSEGTPAAPVAPSAVPKDGVEADFN